MTNYNFECYCEKPFYLHGIPYYSEEDHHRSHAFALKHRYCIRVGKVRVFESGLVSYHHQYEVLYRLWGGLLKQPQALCEFNRPFFFF